MQGSDAGSGIDDTAHTSSDWHCRSIGETLDAWRTQQGGLPADEARQRLERYGPNALREQLTPGIARIALRQFRSIVIIVLVIAGLLAVVMQEWPESIAIAAVIVVNAAIGFFSEWRATRSMEALRRLGEHTTCVRRDDQEHTVPATEVVPGDIVVLRAEALVPADLRVLSSEGLQANESALTGESVPIPKQTEPVQADATLPERASMLYMGTTVVDGAGMGLVVATGMKTEVGRVSELVQEAQATATPLQKQLDRLGRYLAVAVLSVAVVIAAAGLLAGRNPTLMIETAIALGVAAIPEGLPIVATIALAAGMWLMARRNALVNRLPAVETLGATRVIFSDKTGTLTENRMSVSKVATATGEWEPPTEDPSAGADLGAGLSRRLLRIGVLCNGATLADGADGGGEEEPRGDPLEIALLAAGARSELPRDKLIEETPEVRRVSFDRQTMMMATFHETEDGSLVAVKGAPQAVLDACDRVAVNERESKALDEEARQAWVDRADALASQGLRLLAFAEKHARSEEGDPYCKLCLVGLAGLHDPPRRQVRDAINACQAAGIRVVMVTGDKPETAESIAAQAGIVGDPDDEDACVLHGRDLRPPAELDRTAEENIHRANIFARVTPEQKLNLVQVYQDVGETVAMTGDGINDAPALKKADIGIAMGQRGTDAAKQVADMVLRDDALDTIVAAVEQGRVIFSNIRKSVLFMLCTNGAEVLAIAVATLLNIPLPLRPLQILFLNVVTDVFPALALAVGKGDEAVMRRPPRPPNESVLPPRSWLAIAVWSVVIAVCVLGGLLTGSRGLGLGAPEAVTVSFLTLALAKLWFVFNLRAPDTGLLHNEITRNPWIWGAIVLCGALVISAVYLPGLAGILGTRPIGWTGWGVALAISLIPLLVGQSVLQCRKHLRPPAA